MLVYSTSELELFKFAKQNSFHQRLKNVFFGLRNSLFIPYSRLLTNGSYSYVIFLLNKNAADLKVVLKQLLFVDRLEI